MSASEDPRHRARVRWLLLVLLLLPVGVAATLLASQEREPDGVATQPADSDRRVSRDGGTADAGDGPPGSMQAGPPRSTAPGEQNGDSRRPGATSAGTAQGPLGPATGGSAMATSPRDPAASRSADREAPRDPVTGPGGTRERVDPAPSDCGSPRVGVDYGTRYDPTLLAHVVSHVTLSGIPLDCGVALARVRLSGGPTPLTVQAPVGQSGDVTVVVDGPLPASVLERVAVELHGRPSGKGATP